METARSRIKMALVDLLADHEFSRISVTEICRTADLSRVTFYLWYDGKDALLCDIFQDMVDDGIKYFQKLKAGNKHPTLQDDFKNLLETVLYLSQLYHEFVIHLVGKTRNQDQELYSKFNSLILSHVTRLMQEHSDEIRKPLSLSEAAVFITSGLGSMIRQDLDDGMDPAAIHEHAEALLDYMLTSGLFKTVRRAAS